MRWLVRITALRFNVAGLLANSKSSLDQVSRALDLLGDIRSNTDRLQRIDETLYYLKINGYKSELNMTPQEAVAAVKKGWQIWSGP